MSKNPVFFRVHELHELHETFLAPYDGFTFFLDVGAIFLEAHAK